jgi:hypothetical protein
MNCPKCGKEIIIYIDKIDLACIVVYGECETCLKKEAKKRKKKI